MANGPNIFQMLLVFVWENDEFCDHRIHTILLPVYLYSVSDFVDNTVETQLIRDIYGRVYHLGL